LILAPIVDIVPIHVERNAVFGITGDVSKTAIGIATERVRVQVAGGLAPCSRLTIFLSAASSRTGTTEAFLTNAAAKAASTHLV
jgi:hypothetical protein